MKAVLQELVKCCRKENLSAVTIVYHVLKERLAMLQVFSFFLFMRQIYKIKHMTDNSVFLFFCSQIPLIVSLAPRSSGLIQRETLVSPSL